LTLYQLSTPEESLIEPRPVLTPVCLRHFRTLDILESKGIVYGDRNAVENIASFPTLAALISHQLRSDVDTSRFRKKEDIMSSFSFWPEIKQNVPFYLQTSRKEVLTSKRDGISRYPMLFPPRRIFLSTATLVIVPPHLFIQWQSEIHKHCEDGLRVLTLNYSDNMPCAEELANNFDIVLLSTTRKIRNATHII
jgi:hypothetical protein